MRYLCGPLKIAAIILIPFVHAAHAYADPSACDRLAGLIPYVEESRGLHFKRPVACRVVNNEIFQQAQREQYLFLSTPQQLHHEEAVYRLLRFIPAHYEYEHCYLAETVRYISAFYDIRSREIVIPESAPPSDDILVHELVHALQDQHFDLRDKAKRASKTMDRSLAFAIIVEGDARLIQDIYLSRHHIASTGSNDEDTERLDACSLPANLQEINYFPYYFGATYAKRLRADNGARALDPLIRRPPESCAPLIRTLGAIALPLSMNLAESESLIRSALTYYKQPSASHKKLQIDQIDSLGPYYIHLLISTVRQSQDPRAWLQGWRGDLVQLFNTSTTEGLVWKTNWSSEAEAGEFFSGISAVFGARGELLKDQKSLLIQIPDEGTVLLQRSDTIVWVTRVTARRLVFSPAAK